MRAAGPSRTHPTLAERWPMLGTGGVWGREHVRFLRAMQDDLYRLGTQHMSEEACQRLLSCVTLLSAVSGNSWQYCWEQIRDGVIRSVQR